MVIRSDGDLDRIFRALADPTRRRILEQLSRGDRSVNDVGRRFDISQPAVTKHLQVLERAGLIARRRDGRHHYSAVRREALRRPLAWMRDYTRLWNERLDAIEALLDDPAIRKELDHDTR